MSPVSKPCQFYVPFILGAVAADAKSPCVRANRRYTSSAIGSTQASSVKDCAMKCSNTASCLFASYDGSSCKYHSSGSNTYTSGSYALSLKCLGKFHIFMPPIQMYHIKDSRASPYKQIQILFTYTYYIYI